MATRVTCVLPPLLVFLMLSRAAPAAAQRAVVSVFGPVGAPATATVDLAGMRVTPFSSELLEDAVFLADGTLLLRKVAGETVWRVSDLRRSAEVTLPAAGLAGSGFAGGFVAHPRQPALFGRYVDASQISLAKVDASGLQVFRQCALREAFGGFGLSADGQQAVILCGPPPPSVQWQIVVVDTATGAELRRVAIGDGIPSTFALDADGTQVVTLRTYLLTGGIRFALERLDTATGAVLQSVDVAEGGAVVANPRRRTLPLLLQGGRLHTLDARTLAIGPEVRLPGPPDRVSFSANGDRVLVAVLRSAAVLVDLGTGAVLQQAPAPAAGVIMAVWGAEPQAPVLAPPVVAGSAVTLSWTLPVESTAVTGYRLEAGSQTGLADILTTGLGPSPSFAAAGVPPGRYYVRMRALNGNGMSAPSNEVVVNVP